MTELLVRTLIFWTLIAWSLIGVVFYFDIESKVTKEIKPWKRALVMLIFGPLSWAIVIFVYACAILAMCYDVVCKKIVKWLEK